MGGLLELIQQPGIAITLAALALVGLVAAVVALARASRLASQRAAALKGERAMAMQVEAILASSRDGVLITSRTGEIVVLTDVAAHMLGVERAPLIGRPLGTLPMRAIDERGRPLLAHEIFAPGRDDAKPRIVGVPGRRGKDDVRWVHVVSKTVTEHVTGRGSASEAASVTVTTIVDMAGMREAAEAVQRTDAQFRRAVENAPIGMALVDLEWRIMEVNRAFAEMMGTTVAALRGVPFSSISHPQDVAEEREQLQRLYDGLQTQFTVEKRYVRSDGNVVWTVLDVALVRYAGGAPDHYVAHVRDTTDDRMHSELLAHRAMHDPLTGLANRTLMQDVLQKALDAPDASQRVGVLAIDLDGFKGLNDRFGHAAGDHALVHVAGVLRGATAGKGTVARIGGDEFVIVVQDPDCSKAAFDIAAAIHSGLKRPLQVKRHQLNLHASVGVAVADDDAIAGGAPALLGAADAAMYRAKALGKSRTEVYEPSMRVTAENQSALAAELSEAVTRGELVLHYQPIMELASRTVVGYEALVRWQHPSKGLLLPGAFLGLLEDRKLATQLGSALVEQAADFLTKCPSPSMWVSLNVSADQLGDSEFASTVFSVIQRYHLSPQRIVVELTEASLVAPNTRIRHELTELRNAGVPILLDDFGTGVSPLSYLRDLPVSGVKLDMSFVAGIPEDPAGARVSRALGALARELGLATIAEGIETESQAQFLSRCGWRYGQGWLFGVAQPAAAVLGNGMEFKASMISPRPHDLESGFEAQGQQPRA